MPAMVRTSCHGAIVVLVVAVWVLALSPCYSAPVMSSSGPSSSCMLSWLSSLGLSSENSSMYISIFHREEITEKALRLLTLQDLEFLGVASFVHRVLIHNSLNDGETLCKNGGECNPDPTETDSFVCDCLDGFSGTTCEEMLSCSDHVCLNGGNCSYSVGGGVACRCPHGYSGQRCQNDPCHSNPCQNGGSCSLVDSGYSCTCLIGYAGENCENAWLTESDYTAFKTQTAIKLNFFQSISTQLLNSINAQNEKIKEARTVGKGPRFLSHWTTIEGNNKVLHTATFETTNTAYFSVLYSNSTINTYSLAENGNHVLLQTLFLPDVVSFTIFDIGSSFYLAVAKNSSSDSEVYRWSSDEEFVFHSRLSSTKGARDIEFVRTPWQGYYLIVSCNYRTVHINYPTFVFKWVGGRFQVYQYLQAATSGLTSDSVVTGDGDIVLALTHKMGNGNVKSVSYHWNGTYFDDRTEQTQVLPALALGKRLLTVTIGVHTFLIGRSPSDDSKAIAFKYDRKTGQFVDFASIDTPGSVLAVEYFHTSTEHFLVVSNHVVSQSPLAHTSDQYSVLVYSIDGASFRFFQEIRTSFKPSVLRHYSRGDCQGVAIAGSSGQTELYQWSETTNICNYNSQ